LRICHSWWWWWWR
jgi:hypothetical protein